MKREKLKIYVIIVIIVAIFLGILGGFFLKKRMDTFHLKINGLSIDKREYEHVMQEMIYDTTDYFAKTYRASVDRDFWTKDFNGEVPYKVLTDFALKRLKEIRVTYEVAKEEGYVESIDYQSLLERFNTENKTRKEKIEKGEVVYGLSQFDLDLFIEYDLDGIEKKYCNDLEHENMQISEEEQNEYYEANKDKMFQKPDDIEIEYIQIGYEMEGLGIEQISDLKQEMEGLSNQVSTDIASVINQYPELEKYYASQKILSGEMSAQSRIIPDILELSESLLKGQKTQVMDQNGTLYFILCKDRVVYEYYEQAEVQDVIKKIVREEHFKEMIQERMENADVEGEIEKLYQFTKKKIIE